MWPRKLRWSWQNKSISLNIRSCGPMVKPTIFWRAARGSYPNPIISVIKNGSEKEKWSGVRGGNSLHTNFTLARAGCNDVMSVLVSQSHLQWRGLSYGLYIRTLTCLLFSSKEFIWGGGMKHGWWKPLQRKKTQILDSTAETNQI